MTANGHEIYAIYCRASAARDRWEVLGMRNTNGLTDEQRVELDIAYKAAHQEYMDAYLAYHSALNENIRASLQSIEEPVRATRTAQQSEKDA